MKHIFLAALSLVGLTPTRSETLIFSDDFTTLDFKKWQHELTLGGGGNWEFEQYRNNRTNTFVRDGVFHIQPTLTADAIGEATMKTGSMSIWGGSPADECTSNAFYGCERTGNGQNILNPIMSGRVRTVNSFSFTYGRVEVRAQLPKGDWLWPAIWLLPTDQEYGTWPASGEIDVVESRGNGKEKCPDGSSNDFGSTLHWGPNWDQDQWPQTTASFKGGEALSDGFHTYGLFWNETRLETYIDSPSNVVLSVDMSTTDFFTKGGWASGGQDNPWVGEGANAPFNRDFYLILNVAVGGTGGYFAEGMCDKPWSDKSSTAALDFWNKKDEWYPSWNYPLTNDSAMKVDWVKVYSLDEAEVGKGKEEVGGGAGKNGFLRTAK